MRDWRREVRTAALAVGALVVAALAACSADSHVSGPGTAAPVALQSVSPAGGAVEVSVTMPMVMQFSGPVGTGMERYVVVHEGSVSGPLVAGRWSWSEDRRTLTFTPDAPLQPRTTYVVHMGGGMLAANGSPLDYGPCVGLGGRPVSGGMMGGAGTGMMGPGWRGSDGGYGMIFTFTTA
jgi:hypothetical protein